MRVRVTFAAKAYRIPERTVRRWAHDGRVTATKEAGIYYVDFLELGELVELQHAGGGRLAKSPSGRYDAVDSRGLSPEPTPAIDLDPMSGASACNRRNPP
jgi:hypothetical protein